MRRRVLLIGCDDLVAHEGHSVQDAVALREDILPGREGGIVDVGRHQSVERRLAVGEEVDGVSVRLDRAARILHVGRNPDEFSVRNTQVFDIEIVPEIGSVFVEEGHRLLFIGVQKIEPQRFVRVLVVYGIFALRGADLVVEYLVALVFDREFMPLLGNAVGAVEEAVPQPGGAGEFGPFDVVFQQRAGLHVHHVEFLPVASAAGDTVCHQTAVLVEIGALERDRAVVREFVRIEEDALLPVRRIHFVQDALVLQAVVAVDVPFPVASVAGNADFLVIAHFLEPGEHFTPEGNSLEVMVGNLVLGLHPRGRLGRIVIFQPSVRVRDLRSEIGVHGIVFPRRGKFGRACADH